VEELVLISSVMELDLLLIVDDYFFHTNEHGDSGSVESSIMPPRLFSWRICAVDETRHMWHAIKLSMD